MHAFSPGQRWISESEPELGLGIVTNVANRRVEILFPAGGESRLYAIDGAPVRRVRFKAGDKVSGPDGVTLAIESVTEDRGVITYHGGGRVLPESQLRDTMRYDKPEGRLLAGHFDDLDTFDLRLETHRHRERVFRSPVRGFVGGRVDLIPHQLYIAHEVSRRDVPRVLLADEVGLGKTIEACLILHRMLLNGKISRVLILVPTPLVHQWFVELLRRFSITMSIFDETRCDAIETGDPDANPFLDSQLVLCGIDFLSENPQRAAQAAAAGWDLLIVDEAHHLEWSPDAPSREYLLVDHLAQATPGLLLLTATPEQLGLESHFARLRLLDPHRYPDYERFVKEHKAFEAVAKKTNALVAAGDESKLQELLDRHGPGRVMFRNTRATIAGFPKRILHSVPLAPATARGRDPRIVWLAGFLRDNPETKVLVICQTRDDVQAIHDVLRSQITVKTALFHEEMPLIQCDRQAAWFAEADGARVLIASEIGGEGRNFQFVQHLVLVSLPDDPEMLEQRIGRLDRIGQTGDIHIYVPHIKGTAEEGRLRWYHEGLNAFEEALSGSHEIMLKFRARLGSVTDKLVKETRLFRDDFKARIERGRDRLLELSSFRPAVAAGVVEAIAKADATDDLDEYMLRLFDHFGVHAEQIDKRGYLLLRGHMFDSAFPLREEQLRITYDRRQALVREDITLMSWDHPMVASASELLLGSEKGNSAFVVSEELKGAMIEAVFLLECIAPPNLEAQRFLPPTPVCIRVDEKRNVVASRPARLKKGPAWHVTGDSARKQELIHALLGEARERAEQSVPDLLKAARSEVQSVLGAELKRLRALKAVNDHVRADEITALEHRIRDLTEAIDRSELRLDAVLFISGISW